MVIHNNIRADDGTGDRETIKYIDEGTDAQYHNHGTAENDTLWLYSEFMGHILFALVE
jgi:hypothetical protein